MLKIVKNVSIYSLGNVLSAGISFLLLPLYTRVLSPGDYGQLELLYLVASILTIVISLKIESGYSRYFFESTEKTYREELFSTSQAFVLIGSLVVLVLVFQADTFFSKSILKIEQGEYLIRLITTSSVLEVLIMIPHLNLRLLHKAGAYVTASIVNLTTTVAATLFFLLLFQMRVDGVIWGRILGNATMLVFLYSISPVSHRFAFSRQYLGSMLKFSVFIIPANFTSIILLLSNRYFLNEYQNLIAVGIFSLAAKISSIIPSLFTEPIKAAITPYIFEKIHSPEESKKRLTDIIRYYAIGISIVVLFLSLFAEDIVGIIASNDFKNSSELIFLLTLTNLLLGLVAFLSIAIHITKKSFYVTLSWGISAVCNIGLNILLIPICGQIGAAYASLLTMIILLLTYWVILEKIYPLHLPVKELFLIIVCLVGCYQLGNFIHAGIFVKIFAKGVLLISYLGLILFVIRIFTKEELSMIQTYLQGKIGFFKGK